MTMDNVQTENSSRHRGRKAADLTGMTFGRLTAVRRTENKKDKVMWECRCSCGRTAIVSAHNLRLGLKKSCGCLMREGRGRLDITGKRYGKLTALYPLDRPTSTGSVYWKCRCDCGNEVEVSVSDLNKGNNKSCGCLKREYQKLVHDRLELVDGTCVEWLDGRKSRCDNTSGYRGVFKKKNGKFSVSIGFKKKIYYIGVYEGYEEAVEARLRAEEKVHEGFVKAYRIWKEMAERDPSWGEENPFCFEVSKENGVLVVRNSMEEYMKSAPAKIEYTKNTVYRDLAVYSEAEIFREEEDYAIVQGG